MFEREKTVRDLVEVLGRYPRTAVIEEREGDQFWVHEYGSGPFAGEAPVRSISVLLRPNDLTKELFPFISYQIPGTDKWVYIELPDDAEPNVWGAEYDDVSGLMELALGGMEIMNVYKSMSEEEIRRLASEYNYRVYDYRHAGEFQFTHDCVDRTLKALKRALPKE